MSYVFHPAAEAEYLKAIAYYETQQSGLGVSFLSEFEISMVSVTNTPQQFQELQSPGIRKKLLNRFPFTVFFVNQMG